MSDEARTTATMIVGADDAGTVCARAVQQLALHDFDGDVTVLAEAAFDLVRWFICAPNDGRASGVGVVSARSEGGTNWSLTTVCMSTWKDAGDDITAHIGDDRRASVTGDFLNSGTHVHGWTADGALTWTCHRETNYE